MHEVGFLAMFKESFTLIILFFCSVVSLTFMVERWWYFRKVGAGAEEVLGHVQKLLSEGKTEQAQAWLHKNPAAVSQVLHYGLLHASLPRRDVDELMASKRMEEKLKLERYLSILGTLGNTAPFIGLFGTVIGIIKAFRDLAAAGGGGPSVVAKGIAEALVATAGGLVVAIPAVIIYNYFTRRLKTVTVEMEVASMRLLVLMGAK